MTKANGKLTVGLLQMDIHWMQPEKNVEIITRKLDELKQVPQLLVLPEMFTTAYILNPAKYRSVISTLQHTLDQLMAISREYNTALLGSSPWLVGENFYNRCFLIDHDQVSSYDKIHLYTPVGEHHEYTPGEKVCNFSLNGFIIRPLICYDLRFPYLAMMEDPFDLLIYTANWPVPRIHHWNTLLQARAIENQCYTIGVNRTGGDENKIVYNGSSALYRFDGEEMLHLKESQEIHIAELDFAEQNSYQEKLPFSKDRREIDFV